MPSAELRVQLVLMYRLDADGVNNVQTLREHEVRLGQLQDQQRNVEVEVKRLEAREEAQRKVALLRKHQLWLRFEAEKKKVKDVRAEHEVLNAEMAALKGQQEPFRKQMKYVSSA